VTTEALFTPWRSAYLQGGGIDPGGGCLFCELQKHPDDEALVVHRGRRIYAVLNRYPYSSGHVMLTPYAHRGGLAEMTAEERSELVELAATAERVLRNVYRPHGLNVGLNLGKSAGAGVEDHAHLHVVARWDGDTNYFTVIAGTRTIPEDLATTHGKLVAGFREALAGA